MFNVDEMEYIFEGKDPKPRYLFSPKEQDILNSDIELLNNILKRYDAKKIPSMHIPNLNYIIDENFKGPCNYTFLQLNDKTPTDKNPKYKYTVYFNVKMNNYSEEWMNTTFGQIMYLQNGKIGKSRIIIWRKRKLYVVYLKIVDGNLDVSKIEYK